MCVSIVVMEKRQKLVEYVFFDAKANAKQISRLLLMMNSVQIVLFEGAQE